MKPPKTIHTKYTKPMNTCYRLILLVLFSGLTSYLDAQPPKVLDEIIAVVGDKIVLKSEMDLELEQQAKQDPAFDQNKYFCQIFNQLLLRKFLLNRADLDSLVVSEDAVDAELNRRIRYFISLYGNEKTMEEQIGKSVLQLKAENRIKIKEEMLIQQQRSAILDGIKITPNEVQNYFKKIPDDSLPNYDAELEVAQIIRKPKITDEEKRVAYERMKSIRDQILSGSSFKTMARLYSDDKGSGRNGGELDEFGRGDMVPQFEAMAYKLKGDSISPIVETEFGYHIIQLVYRKGDRLKVRHILIRPVTTTEDVGIARNFLDSLRTAILLDSISFENAAKKYSDDEVTNFNGGFFTEQATGSTHVPIKELSPDVYFAIEKLKPGDITLPELITLEDGGKAFRILFLKSETKPHRANLKDDYQKIQAAALQQKQSDVLDKWIKAEYKKVYYRIEPGYKACSNQL